MKLLLIEDESEIVDCIVSYVKEMGFICEVVNSVEDGIFKISNYDYDCILLDLMLKGGNGFEILKELKKQQKSEGVIIISAKNLLETKLEGLQLGADDYITKPFHLAELMARIQAVIRRKSFKGNNIINFNEIELNLDSKTVKVNDVPLEVTKTELDLLLFLISNENRVISKGAIAERISGDRADIFDSHDYIYAHIKNLKKKLQQAGANEYIKTVYGIGYKWQK